MKKVLSFILFVFVLTNTQAQDEKFKALFIYNFTKYIEWPANKQSGDFIIGVFGTSPIQKELAVIAQKKRVGNQKISVKKINSVADCSACNIVFVPASKSSSVKDITAQVKSKGVIVITDKSGLAKTYSGINFVKVGGKQQFEINKKHIEAQGASVNSGLLTLGIPVQ